MCMCTCTQTCLKTCWRHNLTFTVRRHTVRRLQSLAIAVLPPLDLTDHTCACVRSCARACLWLAWAIPPMVSSPFLILTGLPISSAENAA